MSMTKILFLTKGSYDASARERVLNYFRFFKKDGFYTSHYGLSGSLLNYIKALLSAPFSDVVFLQRKLLPTIYFYLLRLLSKKIVYDFDDSVFLNSDGSQSISKNKRFKMICKYSDIIFAGNEFLRKKALKFNQNTIIIPTCLDTTKYKEVKNKLTKFYDLVWVGQKSTSKYLKKIIPYLEQASMKENKIRLVNISNIKIRSPILKIKNITWTESSQYKYISSSHIGIAPLDKNDWSKGKCAFKVLQYAAAGIPILSSDVGVNSKLINKYQPGMLVKNDQEWCSHILKMINNKKLFTFYKKNSLRMAADYDIEKNYNILKIVLKKL